jgi:hypothetical protein
LTYFKSLKKKIWAIIRGHEIAEPKHKQAKIQAKDKPQQRKAIFLQLD